MAGEYLRYAGCTKCGSVIKLECNLRTPPWAFDFMINPHREDCAGYVACQQEDCDGRMQLVAIDPAVYDELELCRGCGKYMTHERDGSNPPLPCCSVCTARDRELVEAVYGKQESFDMRHGKPEENDQ